MINSFFAIIGKKIATNILSRSSSTPPNSLSCDTSSIRNPTLKKAPKKVLQISSLYWKVMLTWWLTSNDLKLQEESTITSPHKVVECSFLSRKFLGEWKKAKVTSIYKKGSKSNCSNYRPISLLSIPSKIVEHLICSQLSIHLSTNSLNEHQWGFRSHRSTEDAILHMKEKNGEKRWIQRK